MEPLPEEWLMVLELQKWMAVAEVVCVDGRSTTTDSTWITHFRFQWGRTADGRDLKRVGYALGAARAAVA